MAGEDTESPSNVLPRPGAGNVDGRDGDPADHSIRGMEDMSFEALLRRVAEFRDSVVAPNVSRWEAEQRMAPEALRDASEIGLLAMEVPTALGGLGMNFAQKCSIVEVLSAVSMPFAFSLVNTGNVAARVASLGTDDHRERYLADLMAGRRFGSTALTEPGAGSDFANIATTATPVEGGWRSPRRSAMTTARRHGSPTPLTPMSSSATRRPSRVPGVAALHRFSSTAPGRASNDCRLMSWQAAT